MPAPSIQLCLVLHNHQPVGNFEHVFEAAYQDSYLPFLDVFEEYVHLQISLHLSGPLAVWMQEKHPEYLARVSELVSQGRIEVLGGAFYEPILPMIPGRDRQGQICRYSTWLEQHLGGPVRGMWMPERVWESELTSDLAQSEIEYTILDDYHFRRAGLNPKQLLGYFVAENEGHVLRVFPGSERLRYLIPFQEAQETIDFCRDMASQQPGCVLVFGDDGEKFGTWPDTAKHVYQEGWLRRFFEALTENRGWLKTTTLAQAVASTPPQGKIYLPDASYREMTEWAMPVEKQLAFDRASKMLESDARWSQVQPFIGGGYWRNFKVKYPESNEMYSRMMYVSQLVEQAENMPISPVILDRARDYLYQGQCNCSYWHGAFGGIYLPHLRNAVYQNLLTAECLIERCQHDGAPWVEATHSDFNFDGHDEIRLANDRLVAWFSPQCGGSMFELDLRDLGHNLLATLQRRPEAYHEKVKAGQNLADATASSIHDRVVFKQEGLDRCLHYDSRLRKNLIDHFWDEDIDLRSVADNVALERGDFADGKYETVIGRNPDRVQVKLHRSGNAWGVPLKLTKGVTMESGQSELEIAYLIEGLPAGKDFHFGVEFNFAGMPADQEDRFFSDAAQQMLGTLGQEHSLERQETIHLTDRWLGLGVTLSIGQAGGIWTYPIQTVSQSEAGFERVHQSVVVQPHWLIRGDRDGRWATVMTLSFGTYSSDNQKQIERMLATN